MPVYEYVCRDCNTRFEQLRPVGRMDDAATCPRGHATGERVLSMFAAITKDAAGNVSAADGGGCGGCSGGDCGGCNLN